MSQRWLWVAFLGSCLSACGSDDGDNTGGASGGSTSGGTGGIAGSGNLGGTAGTGLGGASGSGGAAGSGNSGNTGGTAGLGGALNDACHAMCEQQETGQNCIPEYTETCKQGCNLVTPGLETKCPDVAMAYYDCGAKIEYVCVIGLPTAQDQNACKAENDAMAACT